MIAGQSPAPSAQRPNRPGSPEVTPKRRGVPNLVEAVIGDGVSFGEFQASRSTPCDPCPVWHGQLGVPVVPAGRPPFAASTSPVCSGIFFCTAHRLGAARALWFSILRGLLSSTLGLIHALRPRSTRHRSQPRLLEFTLRGCCLPGRAPGHAADRSGRGSASRAGTRGSMNDNVAVGLAGHEHLYDTWVELRATVAL